jgi:hypothetical protein
MLAAKLARFYPAQIVKMSLLVQCQMRQVGQVLQTLRIAHVKDLRSIISLGLRSVLSCCKLTARCIVPKKIGNSKEVLPGITIEKQRAAPEIEVWRRGRFAIDVL